MTSTYFHLRKLQKFCKTFQIKVKNYNPNSSQSISLLKKTSNESETYGEFSFRNRTVYLNKKLEGFPKIAIFLHELGHFMDELVPHKSNEIDAYNKYMEGKSLTPKQRSVVIACEVRAWDNAQKIATALKIPRGKWLDKERKLALRFSRNI